MSHGGKEGADHAGRDGADHAAHLWARQEKRASLAPVYWDLAGGRPGSRVADVGCGPGYFTLAYAGLAGPTGHVHAVDTDPAALAYLRGRLDPVHHAHVTTELLDVASLPLPELHFDVILCTDALHHIRALDKALANMRVGRARLVLAEFDPAAPGEYGPPLADRIAPATLAAAMRAAGWTPGPVRALDHEHYAIVATPE